MSDDILDKLAKEREIKTIGRIGGGGGVVMISCDIVQEAIAEIARLREERRWISVKERLPDRSVAVLVSSSNGIHRASLDSCGQWLDDDENPGKRVTHWMPLPAPPSEGEVEG